MLESSGQIALEHRVVVAFKYLTSSILKNVCNHTQLIHAIYLQLKVLPAFAKLLNKLCPPLFDFDFLLFVQEFFHCFYFGCLSWDEANVGKRNAIKTLDFVDLCNMHDILGRFIKMLTHIKGKLEKCME